MVESFEEAFYRLIDTMPVYPARFHFRFIDRRFIGDDNNVDGLEAYCLRNNILPGVRNWYKYNLERQQFELETREKLKNIKDEKLLEIIREHGEKLKESVHSGYFGGFYGELSEENGTKMHNNLKRLCEKLKSQNLIRTFEISVPYKHHYYPQTFNIEGLNSGDEYSFNIQNYNKYQETEFDFEEWLKQFNITQF